METIDFSKSHRELYTAKRAPQEVTAGAAVFLSVDGQGTPGGEQFHGAIESLYSVVYTLKFACKHEGTLDFKVSRLECLYLSDTRAPMSEWRWRVMVRVPDAVTAADVARAKKTIKERKGINVTAVKRIRWKEGRAVQVLHVGPYERLGEAYQRLHAFAEEQGLEASCPAHEVYLSDPRRTASEKLKTVVRLGAKKRPCRAS